MSRVEHVIVSSVALDSKFGLFDFGFEINNNMDPGFYLIDYFRKAKQEWLRIQICRTYW